MKHLAYSKGQFKDSVIRGRRKKLFKSDKYYLFYWGRNHKAVAVIYKFDTDDDDCFQELWELSEGEFLISDADARHEMNTHSDWTEIFELTEQEILDHCLLETI